MMLMELGMQLRGQSQATTEKRRAEAEWSDERRIEGRIEE